MTAHCIGPEVPEGGELIAGLEMGTSKICVPVAERLPGNAPRILGIGRAPARGVRKGEVIDSALAGRAVAGALADAEAKSGVMIRSVRLAVSGAHVPAQVEDCLRLLKEWGVEAQRVVNAAEASAAAVLDAAGRGEGALVIDMGGGTTDYAVYKDGSLTQSGSLLMGGDDITDALSAVLRISWANAEALKMEACGGREPGRALAKLIVQQRVREAFQLVNAGLQGCGVCPETPGTGVHLTGGCSMMHGIEALAREVFGLPSRLARVKGIGPTGRGIAGDPRHSCALGLVKMET